jgi:tetratricopeptide (TPR) repeat protein
MKSRNIAFILAAFGLALLRVPGLAEQEPQTTPAADPFYRQYLVKGNALDDQIAAQEQRVQAAPQDASLRNDLGNLLAERRFREQAAEQYEIAAELDPSNFISYYNLGLLRETGGDISGAISAYKNSIARKPGFPQSHFRLGRLYEKTGKPDSAVTEYAKALRIDPDMRLPKRNPLVVDSELIYRASLANYERDLATASMELDSMYVDPDRFRRLPTDRLISAEEAEEEEPAEAPRQIGPGSATGTPASGEGSSARRGRTTPPPDAGILGGSRARTPVPRPPRVARPAPAAAGAAAPAPPPEVETQPLPEGEADPSAGPMLPEPTPTPGPMEIEPS